MTEGPLTLPASSSTAPGADLLDGIAPLPHLGVIRVAGDDAAKFLHGQLTQDFALLGPDEARLAAFCSAKGRMQASMIGFRQGPSEVLLIIGRDILAPTLKRLSMFVMRAKARLSDASGDFLLFGLAGSAAAAHGGASGAARPAWRLGGDAATGGAARVITLYPAAGQARALWIAPAGTEPPAGAPLSGELWLWGEVQSGIATLSAPLVEAFVPQMLNYESVGGVNFKKGCYPGQEVVARSQFRGTLKRRAYLAHADAALEAGQEVFQSDDAAQPVGTVVQVAPAPGGGFDAIVSMQVSAAAEGRLRGGAADGPAIALRALPYALLEDI